MMKVIASPSLPSATGLDPTNHRVEYIRHDIDRAPDVACTHVDLTHCQSSDATVSGLPYITPHRRWSASRSAVCLRSLCSTYVIGYPSDFVASSHRRRPSSFTANTCIQQTNKFFCLPLVQNSNHGWHTSEWLHFYCPWCILHIKMTWLGMG